MQALDVLRCPACGAPAAFGEGDVARCTHCGSDVAIPAPYRELRASRTIDAEARARAERLIDDLDRPPSFALRLAAALLDQPLAVYWFVWAVPLFLWSTMLAMKVGSMIAHARGLASVDDLSFSVFVALIAGFVFLGVGLPRALGVWASRRAAAYSSLSAALAARPPSHPGGPAECRLCGAPLDVAPNALLARCVYCGAESSLRPEKDLLRRTKRAAFHTKHTVAECVEIQRKERSALRRRLFVDLGGRAAGIGAVAALFALYGWDAERAEASGGAPAIGIAALVVVTGLLIWGVARAIATANSDEDATERRERAGASELPGWVRIAGAIGVPALFFVALRLI